MALFDFKKIAENLREAEKPTDFPKLGIDYGAAAKKVRDALPPIPKVGLPGAFGLTDKGSNGEQSRARDEVLGVPKKVPKGKMSSNTSAYKNNTYVEPRVSSKDTAGISKRFGLTGLGLDKQLEGLTFSEANKKAEKMKQERLSQTSANTSFQYDPKSISGFKDTFKGLKLSLKESSDDPFESRDSKTQSKDAILKSYTSNLAKNFGSLDEFTAAQNDPEMQSLLKEYEKMGGSRNDVASAISKGNVSVVSETPNRDGSYNVTYSDGTQDVRRYTQNADGTYTSNKAQTIDQYLGAMSTPDEQQAMQELLPEYKLQQDKIALEQSIPEQWKQYYFGTEEESGFLDQQAELAKEKIKILEKQAKSEEKNLKARVNMLQEQNDWESKKDEAEIEKNRLAAKNYTTGLLAKLGALTTTGAAVQGLATLEQEYQKQAQETRMDYSFANKELDLKMREGVDEIDNTLADAVWTVKNDLSKDEETVWKDIFKMQTDADRKTLDIIDKFAGEFRTNKEKYRKERIAAAKKYADQFSSIIGADDLKGVMEGDVIIKRNKKGKIVDQGLMDITGEVKKIETLLEESAGQDGYVNSRVYENSFNAFVKAGGTRDEFLKQFPPNQYVNPEDPTLPSFLKFGSSSRAEANTDEDELDSLLE